MRSQSKEKPRRSQLAGHVLGAARDPVAGRLAAVDRAQLGGQAESVEAEREQHVLAARALKARVGVADRVGANVADVDVARGERGRGLDVAVRAIASTGGCRERVARRARRPAGAPRSRAGRSSWRSLSLIVNRAYPRAHRPGCDRCYARSHLAALTDNRLSRCYSPPHRPRRARGHLVRATERMRRWR